MHRGRTRGWILDPALSGPFPQIGGKGTSYRFEDDAGKRSEMQVLDWEAGALFWKCFRKSGSEEEALVKVRQRYFEEFVAKDTHFFLGTTQQFHFVGVNPWVIVGVFYPPFDPQMDLF